jgi:hypothetical protein
MSRRLSTHCALFHTGAYSHAHALALSHDHVHVHECSRNECRCTHTLTHSHAHVHESCMCKVYLTNMLYNVLTNMLYFTRDHFTTLHHTTTSQPPHYTRPHYTSYKESIMYVVTHRDLLKSIPPGIAVTAEALMHVLMRSQMYRRAFVMDKEKFQVVRECMCRACMYVCVCVCVCVCVYRRAFVKDKFYSNMCVYMWRCVIVHELCVAWYICAI